MTSCSSPGRGWYPNRRYRKEPYQFTGAYDFRLHEIDYSFGHPLSQELLQRPANREKDDWVARKLCDPAKERVVAPQFASSAKRDHTREGPSLFGGVNGGVEPLVDDHPFSPADQLRKTMHITGIPQQSLAPKPKGSFSREGTTLSELYSQTGNSLGRRQRDRHAFTNPGTKTAVKLLGETHTGLRDHRADLDDYEPPPAIQKHSNAINWYVQDAKARNGYNMPEEPQLFRLAGEEPRSVKTYADWRILRKTGDPWPLEGTMKSVYHGERAKAVRFSSARQSWRDYCSVPDVRTLEMDHQHDTPYSKQLWRARPPFQ